MSTISIPNMSLSIPTAYGHFSRVGPGWSYHDHHHALFEWICCVEGDAIEWVRDEPFRLRGGDWLLLKPGVRHSTLNHSERDFAYISIHFEVEDPELREALWTKSRIHLNASDTHDPHLENAASSLLAWLNADKPNPPLARRLEFMSLMLRLLHLWVMSPDPAGDAAGGTFGDRFTPHEAELAHRIARLLESGHPEHLHIQQLAERFHMSRNHLSRVFSKVYGMSPRRYLSLLQMRKAKELLIHTPMSVERIAEELGFASLSHFSRQFKRWTGVSPKQFRPGLRRML